MTEPCCGALTPNAISRALILLATMVIGCSGESSGPALVPCSGTVTHKGEALAGAEVLFLPLDAAAKSSRSARAVTAADGSYTLGTQVDGDGVIPGKYQVAITARGPGKKIPPEVNPGLPPDEAFLPGPPLIPEKYFRPETSGLTADVIADKNPPVNFDIKD